MLPKKIYIYSLCILILTKESIYKGKEQSNYYHYKPLNKNEES